MRTSWTTFRCLRNIQKSIPYLFRHQGEARSGKLVTIAIPENVTKCYNKCITSEYAFRYVHSKIFNSVTDFHNRNYWLICSISRKYLLAVSAPNPNELSASDQLKPKYGSRNEANDSEVNIRMTNSQLTMKMKALHVKGGNIYWESEI